MGFLFLYVPDNNVPSLLWKKKADLEQLSQCFQDNAAVLNAVLWREGHGRFRAAGLGDPGCVGRAGPSAVSLGSPAGGQRPLLGESQRCKRLCASPAPEEKAECKLHCRGNVPELEKVGFPDGCNVMELKRAFCRIKLKHVGLVLF